MKKTFSFLFLLLMASIPLKAQSMQHSMPAKHHSMMNPRTLNVTATSKVLLPADLIQFNITINAEAKKVQQAYQKHKELEKVLVSLLKKYGIDEADIQFEPMSIDEYKNRQYRTAEGYPTYYQTRQMVSVTFSNFDIYEKIQVALIKHGFDNFSGHFLTTKKEEGKDKALRKAIQKAKSTAKLMAHEAGVALGKIYTITYNQPAVRPYTARQVALKSAASQGLLQYNQVVSISATVFIEFGINSD